MRFPYIDRGFANQDILRVFPRAGNIFKPEIKIVVQYNDIKHKLYALVDSGADSCLFPRDIAEILGLDVRSGNKIFYTGIGGQQIPFYFHEVEICVGKYKFKTMAGFANSGIGTTALLGQRGFFENFKVAFDRKNRYIEVKKSSFIEILATKFWPTRFLSRFKTDP